MKLTSSDAAFYRDLLSITGNEKLNGLLVQYANLQYAKALSVLKKEKDPTEIYRAQGEATAWERVANMHRDVLNVLKNME